MDAVVDVDVKVGTLCLGVRVPQCHSHSGKR